MPVPVDMDLVGDDQDNKIEGGEGNDTISGLQGDDTLIGNGGDDEILGKTGDDKIIGGEGDDTLRGGQGDDFIRGDDGDDRIHGDEGNDEIRAGAGDDTITGGDGNDTIFGGKGSDEMEGGEGEDIFAFRLGNDFGGNPNNFDVVVDFEYLVDLLDFIDFDIDSGPRTISDISSVDGDLVFTVTMTSNGQDKGTITLAGLGDEFDAAVDKGAFVNDLFVTEDQQFGDYFL